MPAPNPSPRKLRLYRKPDEQDLDGTPWRPLPYTDATRWETDIRCMPTAMSDEEARVIKEYERNCTLSLKPLRDLRNNFVREFAKVRRERLLREKGKAGLLRRLQSPDVEMREATPVPPSMPPPNLPSQVSGQQNVTNNGTQFPATNHWQQPPSVYPQGPFPQPTSSFHTHAQPSPFSPSSMTNGQVFPTPVTTAAAGPSVVPINRLPVRKIRKASSAQDIKLAATVARGVTAGEFRKILTLKKALGPEGACMFYIDKTGVKVPFHCMACKFRSEGKAILYVPGSGEAPRVVPCEELMATRKAFAFPTPAKDDVEKEMKRQLKKESLHPDFAENHARLVAQRNRAEHVAEVRQVLTKSAHGKKVKSAKSVKRAGPYRGTPIVGGSVRPPLQYNQIVEDLSGGFQRLGC